MFTPRITFLPTVLLVLAVIAVGTINIHQAQTIAHQQVAIEMVAGDNDKLAHALDVCIVGTIVPTMGTPSKALKKAYAEYNRKYFGNQLPPEVKVVWAPIFNTPQKLYGEWDPDTDTIYVAKEHKPIEKLWRMTLLHEMAHVATRNEEEPHGPKWRAVMHRLARTGAFDNLW